MKLLKTTTWTIKYHIYTILKIDFKKMHYKLLRDFTLKIENNINHPFFFFFVNF